MLGVFWCVPAPGLLSRTDLHPRAPARGHTVHPNKSQNHGMMMMIMVSRGILLKALLVPSTGRDTSTELPRNPFHLCFGAFMGARLHSGLLSGHDQGPMGGAAPEPLDFSQSSIPARSCGHAQRPGRRGLTWPMEPCSHSVTCHQTTGPALSQRCLWVLQGAGHPPPTQQPCGTAHVPPRGCDRCHRARRGVWGGWWCSPAPRGWTLVSLTTSPGHRALSLSPSLPVFRGQALPHAAGPCPGCARQPRTLFLPHQLSALRRCQARAWSRQASQRSGRPSDSSRRPVKCHPRASPRPIAPGSKPHRPNLTASCHSIPKGQEEPAVPQQPGDLPGDSDRDYWLRGWDMGPWQRAGGHSDQGRGSLVSSEPPAAAAVVLPVPDNGPMSPAQGDRTGPHCVPTVAQRLPVPLASPGRSIWAVRGIQHLPGLGDV